MLEDLKEDTESGRKFLIDKTTGQRTIQLRLVAALAAIVVIAAVATVLLLRREPTAARPLELQRLTFDAGATLVPSISPDGNLIAFTSDRGGDTGFDIWVRHINQPEPTRLTEHPTDDWHPDFSPDGSRIVFRVPTERWRNLRRQRPRRRPPKSGRTRTRPEVLPRWLGDRLHRGPSVGSGLASTDVQGSRTGRNAGTVHPQMGRPATTGQHRSGLLSRRPPGPVQRGAPRRSTPE